MDKSNSVLERLIAEFSKDYIDTLLACRSGQRMQVGSEYGKFKLIYVSPKVPMATSTRIDKEISIKGTEVKNPRL
jgi:hypothetical protein